MHSDHEGFWLTSSGSPKPTSIPGNIARLLAPHQRNGIRILYRQYLKNKGVVLNDAPKLGKCVQVSILLSVITGKLNAERNLTFEAGPSINQHKTFQALVLCASEERMLKWKFHLQQFGNLQSGPFNSDNVSPKFVIIESLRSMATSLKMLTQQPWECVVLEWSRNINLTHSFIKDLKTQNRIAIVSEDLKCDLLLLWNAVDWVEPNYLGDYIGFIEKFSFSDKNWRRNCLLWSKLRDVVIRRTEKDITGNYPLINPESYAVAFTDWKNNLNYKLAISDSQSSNSSTKTESLEEILNLDNLKVSRNIVQCIPKPKKVDAVHTKNMITSERTNYVEISETESDWSEPFESLESGPIISSLDSDDVNTTLGAVNSIIESVNSSSENDNEILSHVTEDPALKTGQNEQGHIINNEAYVIADIAVCSTSNMNHAAVKSQLQNSTSSIVLRKPQLNTSTWKRHDTINVENAIKTAERKTEIHVKPSFSKPYSQHVSQYQSTRISPTNYTSDETFNMLDKFFFSDCNTTVSRKRKSSQNFNCSQSKKVQLHHSIFNFETDSSSDGSQHFICKRPKAHTQSNTEDILNTLFFPEVTIRTADSITADSTSEVIVIHSSQSEKSQSTELCSTFNVRNENNTNQKMPIVDSTNTENRCVQNSTENVLNSIFFS